MNLNMFLKFLREFLVFRVRWECVLAYLPKKMKVIANVSTYIWGAPNWGFSIKPPCSKHNEAATQQKSQTTHDPLSLLSCHRSETGGKQSHTGWPCGPHAVEPCRQRAWPRTQRTRPQGGGRRRRRIGGRWAVGRSGRRLLRHSSCPVCYASSDS